MSLPPPDLRVRFGLRPSEVSLADVAAFADDFDEAVEYEKANSEMEMVGAESGSADVFLLGFTEGSCLYEIGVSPRAVAAVGRLCTALAEGGIAWAKLNVNSQERMARAINRVVDRGADFAIEGHGTRRPTPFASASFGPSKRPPEVVRDHYITGPTECGVEVYRVGGSKPTALVRLLSTGERIPVAGRDWVVIRQLGTMLRKRVVLEGEATWRLPDWKMTSFKLQRIQEFPTGNPGDVFEELNAELSKSGSLRGGRLDAFISDYRTDDGDE